MEVPDPGAPAASPPAPVDSSAFLESLSAPERKEFFEGSPEKRATFASKDPAAEADSAPAKPVTQAASTDALPPADSAPAKPAKTKGLDARSAEVDLKIADLKTKLQALDDLERSYATRTQPKPDAVADSSPKAKPSWEQYRDLPDAPKQDDFQSYDDWVDARAEFIATKRYEALRGEEQQTQHAREQTRLMETRATESMDRGRQFWESHPDLQEKVHPALLDLKPISLMDATERQTAGPQHFVADLLWESPVSPQLAVFFSEHPDEFASICALNDPKAMTRAFGRVEERVGSLYETDPAKRATPQPKTIPDADDLPVTLGKRTAATVPETDAAVRDKDFRAFEAAWRRERGL